MNQNQQNNAMQTVEVLFKAAENFHGRTFQPPQVRELASVLVGMDQEIGRLRQVENLFASYVNEYGEELANELLGITEGEVVDDEEGQVQEEDGLDAQVAEGQEPSVEVLEVQDPGPGSAEQDSDDLR